MKWYGVVSEYEVPERFHAMLTNSSRGSVRRETLVEFYTWLRKQELLTVDDFKHRYRKRVTR